MKRTILILIAFMPLLISAQTHRTSLGKFSSGIWGFNGSAVSYTSPYNDESLALFDKWTSPPSTTLKVKTSIFYDTIQYYNVYDSCDCIYNYAVHTAQAASIDWINNDRTHSLINTPVFTANMGYLFNGTDNYANSNYNPKTDAVNYKLNSASLGVYSLTNTIGTNNAFFGGAESSISYIRYTATSYTNRVNSLEFESWAHNGNIRGFTLHNRIGDSVNHARNEIVGSNVYKPSSAITNLDFFIGATNSSGDIPLLFSNNQIAFVSACANLSPLQAVKLFEAERLFLGLTQVICEGNSLTSGVIDNPAGDSYPTILGNNNPNYNITNSGYDGAKLLDMMADAATIKALKDKAYQNNIIVLWGGLNDLRADSTVISTHNKLQTLGQYYQDQEFKVIVMTLVASVSKQDSINDYNTLIKANYTNYADAVVLLDEDARLQDQTNTTYYAAGGLHLITAGYSVVVSLLQPQINAIKED